MPREQWRCTRRAMLKGAVLALAVAVSAGCEEPDASPATPGARVTIGSFHIVGYGMYEAFKRLRTSLTGADRDVFENLIVQKDDLLIHVFLATGRLDPDESRGGASAPASTKDMKRICDFHPIVERFAWERDWDVAYDPELTKWHETMNGLPNPPEVVLYHEIFGHLIPCLGDPELIPRAQDKLFKMKKECEALDIENRYRKQIGLREFPRELLKCPSPER